MKTIFDRSLFTQFGLDSGSLTMLGAVVHSFREPGEYRGVVRREAAPEATFSISVDNHSPVAQANIDLSTLAQGSPEGSTCCGEVKKTHFVVNPKGFVVFHLTSGPGGFSVLVRRAEEDPNLPVFDSRELNDGDLFSATIIRPGTYSMTNVLNRATGEITVSYPRIADVPYRPPNPVTVECTAQAIEPKEIALQPGQGLNFHVKAPARIKISLVKPDDGPARPREPATTGWRKVRLPKD
jgi:hypothetical protein